MHKVLVTKIFLITIYTIVSTSILFIFVDLFIVGFLTPKNHLMSFFSSANIELKLTKKSRNDYKDRFLNIRCEGDNQENCVTHKYDLYFPDGRKIIYPRTFRSDGLMTIEQDYSKNQFLWLGGGSNIHGDGLANNETLAHHLKQIMSDYNVYSKGVRGGALHYFLYTLETIPRENIIGEKGKILYYFWHQHLLRAHGSFSNCCVPHGPKYRLNPDLDFYGAHSIDVTLSELGRLYIFSSNILRAINFDYSLLENYGEEEVDLMCHLAKRAKQVSREKFNSEFYFVYHPFNPPIYHSLLDCLKRESINIIQFDTSKLDPPINHYPYSENIYKQDDGHPNSFGNQVFAKLLRDYLSN